MQTKQKCSLVISLPFSSVFEPTRGWWNACMEFLCLQIARNTNMVRNHCSQPTTVRVGVIKLAGSSSSSSSSLKLVSSSWCCALFHSPFRLSFPLPLLAFPSILLAHRTLTLMLSYLTLLSVGLKDTFIVLSKTSKIPTSIEYLFYVPAQAWNSKRVKTFYFYLRPMAQVYKWMSIFRTLFESLGKGRKCKM